MVYGGESSRFAKEAMDRGRRAHAAMEALDAVGIYPIEYDTMKYIDAYTAWRESRPEFEIVANEKRVCYNQNSPWFCGTIDKLAYDAGFGRVFLIDIKTGETAHPELWRVQMEMYEMALLSMGLYTSGSFVVQCMKDGSFVEHDIKSDTGIVGSLGNIHAYMKGEADGDNILQ